MLNFKCIAQTITQNKNKSITVVKDAITDLKSVRASLKPRVLFHQKLQYTVPIEVRKCNNKTYMQFRKKSTTEEPYYQYKFRPELEQAINEQIQAEQQAGQDYLNMAVFFLHPSVSRPGTGGFFMAMYEEEVGHMKDVIQYQLLRGGKVATPCLGKPPAHDKLTILEAFKVALQMEKTVTELIVNIIHTAEKVKDHQCADYFTSVFLTEQKKSVNELAHHITHLNRLVAEGENALYSYDLQLANKYPYTFKH